MSLNLDKRSWKRVALGDVAAASKEKVDPESGDVERYIAGEHMDTDDLEVRRWGEVGDGYLGPAFHRRFSPGQVLFGSRRTYLRKVAVAAFDGVTANTTFVVETKDRGPLLQEFLPFVMTSEPFHAFAIRESKGSVNPYVNWSDLARYEFGLPPLDEQKRLADLLWAVERERQASVALARVVKRTATRYFDKVVATARSWSFSNWVVRIDAGRSPLAAGEPAGRDEVGVLKVSAVGADVFVPSENKRLLDPSDFRPGDAIREGDLLVTRANAVVDNVVRPCVVDDDHPNLMLSDKTLRVVLKQGVPSRVVLAALRASAYRQHVRETVGGTEAKNISQAAILAGPVPQLSQGALERLQEDLEDLDLALRHAQGREATVTSVKASILAGIFGGEA